MKKIVICVCTRKREEGLIRLLTSFDRMIIPVDCEISVVIVENDEENYTEESIKKYAEKSKFKIKYFLEVNQGLSNARNRTVKEAGNCDFCCFIDDDQEVDTKWMSELLSCQDEFDADGITGPNPAVFKKNVPEYVKKFHEPDFHVYGEQVEKAATNNFLIKKRWLDKIDGPFEIKLNFTGGEDMYMSALISRNGGKIIYNPKAIAYEIIPEEREKVKYMLRRKYRIANCNIIYNSLLYGKSYIYKSVPRIILRLINGIITLLPYYIFSKKNKLKGLLKIADVLGRFKYLFGGKSNFYVTSK